VSLVEDQGYTTAQAARELGINDNLLRTWRKKYGKAAASGSKLSESDQEELSRLRKEVSRLRMERDILKKATAFFATEKN
jgi:transposase